MKTLSTALLLGLGISSLSLLAEEKWDLKKLDASKLPPVVAKPDVSYAKDIRPLLEAACFRCHGEERQKGELRLDDLTALLKGGENGKMVVPGDSKASLLVFAAAQIDDEIAMPPKRRPGGPGGPGGPGARAGRPEGPAGFGGPGGPAGGENRPPGGPGGPAGGGDRGRGGAGGPGGPSKPLTAEPVGLIRAWIDQGAKP